MDKINPFVENRIVSDTTFAVRLNSFLSNIQVNDMMSEEELEYVKRVAKKLLAYQVLTAKDKSEVDYLKRLGHLNYK